MKRIIKLYLSAFLIKNLVDRVLVFLLWLFFSLALFSVYVCRCVSLFISPSSHLFPSPSSTDSIPALSLSLSLPLLSTYLCLPLSIFLSFSLFSFLNFKRITYLTHLVSLLVSSQFLSYNLSIS